MSKIGHYLQEHLLGEVTDNLEVRRYFSTDSSILQMRPTAIVYPRNEDDIRKTIRFSWQLAERGRLLPITARGSGSNTSGAAIGNGIMLIFPAHMNRILAFDPKKQAVMVEPGITYEALGQMLYSHGWFLPPYPSSQAYSTVGGGIASNYSNEKSIKYGAMEHYAQHLRVVLSNGEVIEAGPLNKRELSHKMGLTSFEGQIYRELDKLIEESFEILSQAEKQLKSSRNVSGYNLFDIKSKGSFNLVPLFVGSQGTLGIISEATLSIAPYSKPTELVLISLDSLDELKELLPKILELSPSIFDFVSKAAMDLVKAINPSQLAGALARPNAAIHLFIEFDNYKESDQKKDVKKLRKMIDKSGAWTEVFASNNSQDVFWKIRQSVSTILVGAQGQSRAVPVAEDISVPVDRLVDFLHKAEEVYASLDLTAAAWGQAGVGVVRMRPTLNLSELGDRQKLFNIAGSLYDAAIEMGGSTSASAGDGRIRAPYIQKQYGEDFYNLMLKVKKIFDPYGLLNPGVKTASLDDVKSLLRSDYKQNHYDQLPLE